eukprot:NODE_1846_length_1382_cov_24.136534_g1670_i0.p2 GENE.NODE_1846_length_1382_cov_24.136534_g1670_i0~~NODE_1846_length_1382_cov_24.136534_g1670_i0.p2  ORF type:complete len:153 (-),score=33.76 NODE_1846_length_1382_cov_24.136534_g1670_i0:847-1305(-)
MTMQEKFLIEFTFKKIEGVSAHAEEEDCYYYVQYRRKHLKGTIPLAKVEDDDCYFQHPPIFMEATITTTPAGKKSTPLTIHILEVLGPVPDPEMVTPHDYVQFTVSVPKMTEGRIYQIKLGKAKLQMACKSHPLPDATDFSEVCFVSCLTHP